MSAQLIITKNTSKFIAVTDKIGVGNVKENFLVNFFLNVFQYQDG